jgi:hypothetical protein
MHRAARCYRLTLVLDTATFTGDSTPVQVVVQSIWKNSCCIARITYEQAAILLVKAFQDPMEIRDRINTLLAYNLVEVCWADDSPCLFSATHLNEIGIALDFKQVS